MAAYRETTTEKNDAIMNETVYGVYTQSSTNILHYTMSSVVIYNHFFNHSNNN